MVLVKWQKWLPCPYLKIFSRTRSLMTLGLGMLHLGCGAYQVCSNDNPRLTLTYLTSRSNLLPNALNGKSFEKLIFRMLLKPKSLFLLDILNLMRQCKFQRSRLTFQPRSLILESHQYILQLSQNPLGQLNSKFI